MRQHLDNLATFLDRWVTGYGISTSSTSFDVNIEGGVAVINGNQIGKTSDSTVTKTLTSNATNYIFLGDDGNLDINTTGTQPSNSIKLYEVTTDGNGVTNVTDSRDDTVSIDDPLDAHSLEATNGKKQTIGGETHLQKSKPEITLEDTNDNTKTVLKAQNGSLELLDEASDGTRTKLRDDLRTTGTSSATADTIVKRDANAEAAFSTISLTNLSSGSIPFAASGGDRLIKDSNLHWDDNNDRLGILTSSPGSTIDVQGGDLHVQGPDDTSVTHTIEQGANTADAGTPSYQIDLLGSAGASNPVLRLNDDGSLEWGTSSAAPDTKLSRPASNRLALGSDDSLRIQPDQHIYFDGSTESSRIKHNSTSGVIEVLGNNLRLGNTLELQIGTDTNLYRNSTNELKTDDDFSIAGASTLTGVVTLQQASGQDYKLTESPFTTESIAYVGQNGTATRAGFDIIPASSDRTDDLRLNLWAEGNSSSTDPRTTLRTEYRSADDDFAIRSLTVDSGGTASPVPIRIEAGNGTGGSSHTNQLFLATDGNVGIGTNSPTKLLQLNNGDIRIVGGSTSTNAQIYMQTNSGQTWIVRTLDSNSNFSIREHTASTIPFQIESGSPSNSLVIKSTGSTNLNQNQIKDFVIDQRTSDPSSPAVGQIWYRTDLD